MANSTRTIRVKFAGDASGLAAAAVVGGKSLGGWRDKLAKVDKSFKDTATVSGESVAKVNNNLGKVDSQIANVKNRLAELTTKFAETGDIKLFGDMARDKSLLTKLQQVRKEIDEATQAAGKQGGDNLRTGLSGGFLNGAKNMLKSAGKFGSNIATSMVEKIPGAFGGALSALPPQAQVAIVAAIVTAIAAGSAFIGAALSGAMLAGLGTGVLAAGVALAFRDPRIKAAGGDLGKMVMAGLEDAGSVFIGPVLKSIDIVKDGWRGLAPDIKRAFSAVSPYVDNLTRGVVALAKRMMPGLLSALEKSGPILSMIGSELGDLGAAFGTFFRDVGGSSDGARMALKTLFDLIEAGVVVTGKVLAHLADAYKGGALLAALASRDFPTAIDILKGKNGELKESNEGTGISFQRLTEAQQREILALGSGSVALQGFRDRTEILNGSMQGAIQKAGSLAAALDILNGRTLNAREASRNYEAAIDAVNASLQANGQSLNKGTEAGRANLATLDGLARAAATNADAIYQQTAQTGNTALAQQKATAAYNAGRAELIKAYLQFDNNKARAKAYADSIMKIPSSWTTKPIFDDKGASGKITGFIKKINTIDGRVITVTARFTPKGDLYIPGQGTQLKARGGYVRGPGTSTSDSIPARLSDGEYVVRAAAVKRLGAGFLNRLNQAGSGQAETMLTDRSWLGGDASWATSRTAVPAATGASGAAATGGGETYVYVTIDGQQLEGRIDRVVRETNRGLKRRATAGAGAVR